MGEDSDREHRRERSMSLRLRRVVSFSATLLLGLAAGVAFAQSKPPAGGAMPVHRAEPGKLKISVDERGVLEATVIASVVCEVEVQTTIIKLVPEGTNVKKGDVLCELASAGLRERLTNQQTAADRAE